MSTSNVALRREQARRYYWSQRKAGLCTRCRRPATHGGVHCAAHKVIYLRARAARRRGRQS